MVTGSGFDARSRSRKASGVARKTGTLIMVMCWRPPSGNLNCRAMPCTPLAASDWLGLPPPREKRATTGTGWPLNKAERL
ncbi:hypothetical protein D9M69_708130 [compost metagenome]